MTRIFFLLIVFINFTFADAFLSYWMTQEGRGQTEAIILIQKLNNKYIGTIKYVAYVDKNFNIIGFSDDDEFINLQIINDLEKTEDNVYKHGTIVDPTSSFKYYLRARVQGNNLILRGSLDPFSILGASRVWKRVDESLLKYIKMENYDKQKKNISK